MRLAPRPALLALITVLLASAASVQTNPDTPRHAFAQEPFPELIIEILPGDEGFNPQECTINRNLRAEVRFLNRDTKPRRIVVDELYSPEPGGFSRDTGWIEPGQKQEGYWSFGEIQDLTYRDHDEPSITGHITVPLSNQAATMCDPDEPQPEPEGTGCMRHFAEPLGCVLAPRVTTDGPLQ